MRSVNIATRSGITQTSRCGEFDLVTSFQVPLATRSGEMLAKRLLSFKPSSTENFDNFHDSEKMKTTLDESGEEAYRARAGRKRHSVQLDKKLTQQLMNLDRRSSTISTGTADSLCKLSPPPSSSSFVVRIV